MFGLQVTIIGFIFIISILSLTFVLKNFKQERFMVLFLVPLGQYCFGFALRLSAKNHWVDLGFFLTDYAAVFLTALFSVFLFLGQLKYWKK